MECEDLRLTLEEACELLDVLYAVESHEAARAIWEACRGQVALVRVLGRLLLCRPSETKAFLNQGTAVDLQSHLLRLAAGLAATDKRMLYVCALIGHGTSSDMEALFRGSRSALKRIQDAIPLVQTEPHATEGTAFHVHDAARVAFTSPAYAVEVGDDDSMLFDKIVAHMGERGLGERVIRLLIRAEDPGRSRRGWPNSATACCATAAQALLCERLTASRCPPLCASRA